MRFDTHAAMPTTLAQTRLPVVLRRAIPAPLAHVAWPSFAPTAVTEVLHRPGRVTSPNKKAASAKSADGHKADAIGRSLPAPGITRERVESAPVLAFCFQAINQREGTPMTQNINDRLNEAIEHYNDLFQLTGDRIQALWVMYGTLLAALTKQPQLDPLKLHHDLKDLLEQRVHSIADSEIQLVNATLSALQRSAASEVQDRQLKAASPEAWAALHAKQADGSNG